MPPFKAVPTSAPGREDLNTGSVFLVLALSHLPMDQVRQIPVNTSQPRKARQAIDGLS